MLDLAIMLQQCAPDIHPRTMVALIQQESRLDPFAININSKGFTIAEKPKTKREAITYAKAIIADGKNIDMGLAQINSANLKWLNVSIEDMFDPCKNLAAAARILQENYANARKSGAPSQTALNQALSVYNTGNSKRGFENGYVQKVHMHAKTLVQGGEKVPAIHVPGAPTEANQSPLVLSAAIEPAKEDKPKQPAAPELVFKSADAETENALVY